MKRKGWFVGRKVMRKCDVEYCHKMNTREFEFGNFCQQHFEDLPSCSNTECDNPTVPGVYNPDGLCRECLFDYRPNFVPCQQSSLSDSINEFDNMNGVFGLGKELDRTMKKYKIESRGVLIWKKLISEKHKNRRLDS